MGKTTTVKGCAHELGTYRGKCAVCGAQVVPVEPTRVRTGGTYDYELPLISRPDGEGEDDVALVLSKFDRIALVAAIGQAHDAIDAYLPNGRKGLIWHMIESVVYVQEQLLERLKDPNVCPARFCGSHDDHETCAKVHEYGHTCRFRPEED
jgi:hypothetical protein